MAEQPTIPQRPESNMTNQPPSQDKLRDIEGFANQMCQHPAVRITFISDGLGGRQQTKPLQERIFHGTMCGKLYSPQRATTNTTNVFQTIRISTYPYQYSMDVLNSIYEMSSKGYHVRIEPYDEQPNS